MEEAQLNNNNELQTNTIMKRYLFLLAFVCLICNCNAQILMHFTCNKAYDKNGVQHSVYGHESQYFTLGNNIIYQCDKNGNYRGGKWIYRGEKNGIYVYEADAKFAVYPYLYLSKDFKKINLIKYEYWSGIAGTTHNYEDPGWTYVFEEMDPNDIGSPSTFY